MAQITSPTGGISKKSNTITTKLDFNIKDLAPALNKTQLGEDKATVIENMRKQVDGSYLKRSGTQLLLSVKDDIIKEFGEDAWKKYNSSDTFTDIIDGINYDMILVMYDGQPYIKNIKDNSKLERIPMLIYKEINQPHVDLSLEMYEPNGMLGEANWYVREFATKWHKEGEEKDSYITQRTIGRNRQLIHGMGATDNFEKPIQGLHQVFYDKVHSEFASKATADNYKGSKISFNYDSPFNNENINFIDIKYQGWKDKDNLQIKTYNLNGRQYIVLEDRIFEINLGNNLLKMDKVLQSPWGQENNFCIDERNRHGLDSWYYTYELNEINSLWYKDKRLNNIDNKQYYLVELPHTLVPPVIYSQGVRNFNAYNPATAVPYFVVNSSSPDKLLVDYGKINDYGSKNNIIKTNQRFYEETTPFNYFKGYSEYKDDEEIEINNIDIIFNTKESEELLFKIIIENDTNKERYKVILVDSYKNKTPPIFINKSTFGKLKINKKTNDSYGNIYLEINDSFLVDILFAAVSGKNQAFKYYHIDQDKAGDLFNNLNVIVRLFSVGGSMWEIANESLNESLGQNVSSILFHTKAMDYYKKFKETFWDKIDYIEGYEYIKSSGPTFLIGIKQMININFEFKGDEVTTTIINSYIWQSIKNKDRVLYSEDDFAWTNIYDFLEQENDVTCLMSGNENLYINKLSIVPSTLIIDYNPDSLDIILKPVYSGLGYYATANNEDDASFWRDFNLGSALISHIWHDVFDDDPVSIYNYDISYDYNISLNLSGTLNPSSSEADIYNFFEMVFSLDDEVEWVVVYGMIDSPIKDLIPDYKYQLVAEQLNSINNIDFERHIDKPIHSKDTFGINYTLIVSIPSNIGFVESRYYGQNADPLNDRFVKGDTKFTFSPYRFRTVSWNIKKLKTVFNQFIVSQTTNIHKAREDYFNGIRNNGNINKLFTIKGHLVIVKDNILMIDMYNNNIFNYVIRVEEGKIKDAFIYQGKLFIVTDSGKMVSYDIKDGGVVDGLSFEYKSEIDFGSSINGSIRSIAAGSEFIYVISDSGIYLIYSISFSGAEPTIKTRTLSKQLEPIIINDISNAKKTNIIIFGDTVLFVLSDIENDDGSKTTKVYIRDKIQNSYFWSVFVGDVWNIYKIIQSENINDDFIYLTYDSKAFHYGAKVKILPEVFNSPTELVYLDAFKVSNDLVVGGEKYKAFLKTNLINSSSPYDVEVYKVWLKINFLNKKSTLVSNISYEKNGEMFRNNVVVNTKKRENGDIIVGTKKTNIDDNIITIKKKEIPITYKMRGKKAIKYHINRNKDIKSDTDKFFDNMSNVNVAIKNSSFSTSMFSIEFYHSDNAPIAFNGIIVEQKRKDKILK